MTREEIANYRDKLRQILTEKNGEKERLEALKDLAKKVGAGSTRKSKVLIRESIYGKQEYQEKDLITEAELVLNINNALQTETMIDMCRTAAKGYEIARDATKAAIRNYYIAGAIAILALIATWVSAFVVC